MWENFMKAVYLYPAFKSGMVELKNGQRFTRPMNYNRIAATVEFIDEKKDTLAFADESAVSVINIDGVVFVYNPICLRLLSSNKAKLYVYEKMKIGDKQKVGAMGVPSASTTIESVEKIDMYHRSYDIDVNQTVILSKTITYFIQSGTSDVMVANKKNTLKLFSSKESEVKDYLNQKNISFNKQEDLMSLVKFLDNL